MSTTISVQARFPKNAHPQRRSVRFARRLTPVAFHAAAECIPLLVWIISGNPVVTLSVGGVANLVVYAVLAFWEARRVDLLVTPLSFYFAWFTMGLGLSPISLAARISGGAPISFSVATLTSASIAKGYLVFLAGSVALHLGVLMTRPEEPTRAADRRTLTRQDLGQFLLVLWIVGVIAKAFGERLSMLGGLLGILVNASMTSLCFYAIVWARRPRPPHFWILLGGGVFIELMLNLRTGSKGGIMYSFIPVLWVMLRARELRKYLPVAMALLGAFYVVIVAPVVTTARHNKPDAADDYALYLIRIYRSNDIEKDEAPLESLMERQFDPMPVAFLVAEVERYGLRWGTTMDYLLYAFVPRFIWPDKPSVTRGAWFTVYLGQANDEASAKSSTGQTAPGELYWNFGVIGVVIGMLLLGLTFGGLWRLAGPSPEIEPLRLLLYLTVTFGMPDMPEAGTMLVGNIYRAIVFGGVFIVMRKMRARFATREVAL